MRSPALRKFQICTVLLLLALFGAVVASTLAASQSTSPAPPAALRSPQALAEFSAAADEVMAQMSKLTGLSQQKPLKKTLRSREEIRAYLLKQMDEDKDKEERYASAKSAEAFGLIPKGFDLDAFLVDLLTEQIAGLYDPKAQEFYIADWIPLDDQRMVMAHELTHALEDQHYRIDEWEKAAKPNSDAELAREAVLEGSATAAMVDYMLQSTGKSLNDLPDFDPSAVMGDMGNAPELQKAPPFIKDVLIFPYISGMSFSTSAMKPGGWSSLPRLFDKPPVSTQQILHPNLYKLGKLPEKIELPGFEGVVGPQWKKLEEDVMGELGWREVLRQFLDHQIADSTAAHWSGDKYATFEDKATKKLLLVTRIKFDTPEHASRFFGQYSEALEKKYASRSNLLRRANYFSFDTPDGGVFLRCFDRECTTLEGSDRALFIRWNKTLEWGPIPEMPREIEPTPARRTARAALNAGPNISAAAGR